MFHAQGIGRPLEPVPLGHLLGVKGERSPAGVISTSPGATVRQALRLMSQHDVSQLPVMDGHTCVGSVSENVLSVRGLEDVKVLELTVGDTMDSPFPVVDADHPMDAIVKLLSKSNPAVLVHEKGEIRGIVTRSDMLHYLMAR